MSREVAMYRHTLRAAAVSLLWLTAAHAAPTTLYAFTGTADGAIPVPPMLNVNGTLYGVTSAGGANSAGTVFAFNSATKSLTTLYSLPQGAALPGVVSFGQLAYSHGLLYGSAELAGAGENGIIFSVDIAANSGVVDYTFQGGGRWCRARRRRHRP